MNSSGQDQGFDYPQEAMGNQKRIKEWDSLKSKHHIHMKTRNLEQAKTHLLYKWWCENNGLDTCHLYISHAQADMEGFNAIKTIPKPEPGTIVFNQQNTYISQVDRLRRMSEDSSSANKRPSGTTTTVLRLAIESYILLKALQMPHSFCFRDFLELSPDLFKKAVLRLKKKDLITTREPRSCPRFYQLTPKFLLSVLSENTRVGHLGPELSEGLGHE